jgi:putative transposase
MNELYSVSGISKQGLWKHQRHEAHRHTLAEQCVAIMNKTRINHKQMGSRAMFYAAEQPPPVGRDIFEAIGLSNGFRVKRKKNKLKTTWGQRVTVYPNLVDGLVLTGINQVWQSDIFYQIQKGKVYYGVTITDIYSRELLALHLSTSLKARENIKALKKALLTRQGYNLKGCIFHSDRGTQYISEAQTQIVLKYKMKLSMCKMPQQNAYVERIQGTIKNQYLCDLQLKANNLNRIAQKVTYLYNHERPHQGLNMATPVTFKKYVENLPENNRPEMLIFKYNDDLSTKSDLLTKRKK